MYGKILEEELVEGEGMTMVVKEKTHQEVRNGKNCKARRIDHIYSNSAEKLRDTRTVMEAGSHHSLVLTTLLERMEQKGPQQHRARVRKNYSKEKLLTEMDKKDWKFEKLDNIEQENKLNHLKSLVSKLEGNLRCSMDTEWPMRTINRRVKTESWLDDEEIIREKQEEN